MSKQLKITDEGLIYRNPIPHVKSEHAFFPSVITMENGEMLATVVMGEAFEAPNLHTNLFRSTDNGKSWQRQGELYPGTADRLTSDCARICVMPDGEIVVFMIRHDRTEHPDEGLTSHKTLGFVPTELLLLRSADNGYSWTDPQPLIPPLVGPAFEMCSPITLLANGKWVIPTQTWPGYDGDCPNGIRMIGLISYDSGNSWPEYVDIMREPGKNVYFWESKIVTLHDGRLLAVAWVYDDEAKCDRQNHFSISDDMGKTWSKPSSMGLYGQTLTPFILEDGRILCVYRRMDKPGLWAAVSQLNGMSWTVIDQIPLWGTHQEKGLTTTSEDMAHNFNVLRFGAPCITRTPAGEIFMAFWCYEDCVGVIRWFKLLYV